MTALGLISCLVLMISLPWRAWIAGAAAVAVGVLYYWGRTKGWKK